MAIISGGVLLFGFVMPFYMEGDGTAVGRMHVALLYPFAATFSLMTLGTLWLSSGSISHDISSQHIQSIMVKPVRPSTLWFARWFAICCLNTLWVSLFACSLLFSITMIKQHYAKGTPDRKDIENRVLLGRKAITPDPYPDLMDEAEMMRRGLIRQRLIPQETSLSKICGEIKIARSTVAPGKQVNWHISVSPRDVKESISHALSLRYRFGCNPMERVPISGTWVIHNSLPSGITNPTAPTGIPVRAQDERELRITVSNIVDGIHTIMLPPRFHLARQGLQISFISQADGKSKNPTIYFDQDVPVELLIHQNTFLINLLYASLLVICFMASIAAIGLMMGAIFSFPVATFGAMAVIFAVALASAFSEAPQESCHHTQNTPPAKIVQITEPLLLAVKHATAHFVTNIPITPLASGTLISGRQLCQSALLLLLIIPLLSGILSSTILTRKELAV